MFPTTFMSFILSVKTIVQLSQKILLKTCIPPLGKLYLQMKLLIMKYIFKTVIFLIIIFMSCSENRKSSDSVGHNSSDMIHDTSDSINHVITDSIDKTVGHYNSLLHLNGNDSVYVVTCTDSDYPVKYVNSPYGLIKIADTAETWEIYSWLSKSSGSNSIDSLNTVILIELVNQFDGSLAESGSYLCLNDFRNKTETALNVFKYADKTKLEQYFMSLGWRLDNSDDILDKYIQEIVANVKNEENLNMLSEITEKLRKYAHESRENW